MQAHLGLVFFLSLFFVDLFLGVFGQALAEELARRLGRERLYILSFIFHVKQSVSTKYNVNNQGSRHIFMVPQLLNVLLGSCMQRCPYLTNKSKCEPNLAL